jgi:hypothetical protein
MSSVLVDKALKLFDCWMRQAILTAFNTVSIFSKDVCKILLPYRTTVININLLDQRVSPRMSMNTKH